jgi:hypothetical protein
MVDLNILDFNMANWARKLISVFWGIVFGIVTYKVLTLFFADFFSGTFLWAIVITLSVLVISSVDKSILENENSEMLHEKLAEDLKKIYKGKKKR